MSENENAANALIEYFSVNPEDFLDTRHLKRCAEFLSFFQYADVLNYSQKSKLHDKFYYLKDRADYLIRSFPHLYRPILSICNNLELLTGESFGLDKAFIYSFEKKVYLTELTLMRMLETKNIFRNRGFDIFHGLENEVVNQINPDKYTFYDRDSAYFFTHYVFFLTDFGNMAFKGDKKSAKDSCIRLGIYAYVSDDLDLLSEICLSLWCLDEKIPSLWCEYILNKQAQFEVGSNKSTMLPDEQDYHRLIVSNWALSKMLSNHNINIVISGRNCGVIYKHIEHNELLGLSNMAFHFLSIFEHVSCGRGQVKDMILKLAEFERSKEMSEMFPEVVWIPTPLLEL
ncbi:DUF6902 family protein [Scandinavium sp. NPDC088450]|uniref:DUF6902 family protein n=1 Tax=Scandinavium sp. NPDC088450 TaxID=3364514 RepID=UPI00384E79B2